MRTGHCGLHSLIMAALLLAASALVGCAPTAKPPAEPPPSLWQGQMYDGAYKIQSDQPRSLMDAPISIRLTGMQPGQPVTLRAHMALKGRIWESRATFTADGEGIVYLTRAAPIHRTYTGIDPMGLFWSMMLVGTDPAPAAGSDEDPVAPIPVTLVAEAAGKPLASRQIERLFYDVAQVTRRPVREAGPVATLFTPTASGPHPAVICLSGSEGGLLEGYAAVLASHGFATLALGYFGRETLPQELVEIPLESLKAGIDWLKKQPEVDARRIAVLGGSKGGELALLLAATYPDDIAAAVAFKPSSVVWLGVLASPADSFRGPKSSWTKDGQPLPFVSGAFTADLFKAMFGRPAALVTSYEGGLTDARTVESASIPVERMRGPVLLISGAADQMWPSARMASDVMKRLDVHAFPYRHESLVYEEAGHGLNLPYLPTTTINSGTLLQGGTPQATAAANADAWPRVLAFLENALR
jgi:dienelactone hydrolase